MVGASPRPSTRSRPGPHRDHRVRNVSEDVRPDPSDADLVARAREGDGSAFGMLVSRHERRVYNLAYRMMGRPEDARDVAQDAFLSCFRHLGSFRGDAAFTTW